MTQKHIHFSSKWTPMPVPNLLVQLVLAPSPSPSPSSSSMSSEEEEDIWTRRYVQNCYEELRSPQFVRNLIEVLYPTKCLPDFMLLVKQLAAGNFSPTNIAFLLCLERSRWEFLVTTTQMHFRAVTKQFWLVVYRLLKGKGFRFLSGPKNWGQVVSEEAPKGKYDPKKSEVNFAVPDERYLQSMDSVLGRIIDPGIIDDSMKMIEGHKDIVLMADCKQLAKGLKGDSLGDVDLWGHEGNPTMKEKLEEFREQYSFLTQPTKQLPDSNDDIEVYMNLIGILKMITEKIGDVRLVEIQECRQLLNHERCNPDPGYKTAAKSSCRAHIYECKIFVNHALELNNSICKALSHLQKNYCSFNSSGVCLESQQNVRRLHDTQYVGKHLNLHENPKFVKQGSCEWQSFRHEAYITGSTAHSAMGFRGLSEVQKHF